MRMRARRLAWAGADAAAAKRTGPNLYAWFMTSSKEPIGKEYPGAEPRGCGTRP